MGHLQATRSGGMGPVKLFNNLRRVLQIRDRLPCPFGLIISFLVHQVLKFSFINMGVNDSIHFIFFVTILSDMDWSRAGDGLAR